MEEFEKRDFDFWSLFYVEEDESIIGKDMFRGTNQFVNEIMSVAGPLISVYVNGDLFEEIDLLFLDNLSKYVNLERVAAGGTMEAEKYVLKITKSNGTIVEIKSQKNRFLNRKEVKDIVKELSLKGRLKVTQKERDGKLVEQYIELNEKLDGLMKYVKDAFFPCISRGFFVVEDKSISFDNTSISVD
jgi:hypothetical protein